MLRTEPASENHALVSCRPDPTSGRSTNWILLLAPCAPRDSESGRRRPLPCGRFPAAAVGSCPFPALPLLLIPPFLRNSPGLDAGELHSLHFPLCRPALACATRRLRVAPDRSGSATDGPAGRLIRRSRSAPLPRLSQSSHPLAHLVPHRTAPSKRPGPLRLRRAHRDRLGQVPNQSGQVPNQSGL